jgi:transposase-like protein
VRPLPLVPAGSVAVSPGVDVHVADDASGVVFLWGMAAWCWSGGDEGARRLAAVQLVASGQAPQRGVAEVFGVNETTLWRWRADYAEAGVAGLVPERKGPKGPWKLREDTVAEIASLRAGGASLRDIAGRVGLSTDTVRRALVRSASSPTPASEPGGELEPLARPEPREEERQAAARGELAEAEPRITEGASLPLAGALVILPALAATGLLDAVVSVFRPARAAFYGLRSLVLTIVFAALVGEPRAEGLTRLNPVDVGRLLGLDRAPEVRCLRARMHNLASQGRSAALLEALARRHVQANTEAAGVFYVDGHVRAYHGHADVPKAHVARMRLSMPAELDTWVADARGDGVLVWQAPPGASLVGELRRVAAEVRSLVGPDARPMIIFDRGGWSPTLFAELVAAGFDIATYRKGPKGREPRSAFTLHRHVDDLGRTHDYWLADRKVRLAYDNRRRRFACRQITRLDPDTGHQTQVITTRTDPDPAPLAQAMFSRWRQENFFRYMRAHYALDGLDTYTTLADDPDRVVPNPARKAADAKVAAAKAAITAAETAEGRAHAEGRRTPTDTKQITAAFAAARAELAELHAAAKAIPAKAPLGESHPDAARLDPERKRIHDAVRMATYNAESALVRLLAPHYARAEDEARSLLREVFASPADLEVLGNQLHVRINPLSAPRRTRALAALCQDLTATETTYPGTDLVLVYTVKDA